MSAAAPARCALAVIPALNEAACIGEVVLGIAPYVDGVVVVDNGSADRTSEVARAAGAEVVMESRRGYGRACLAGIAHAKARGATMVLFLDADGSDAPDDAPLLIDPVSSGRFVLALGVRAAALCEPGSMTRTQRFGNWFGPWLMHVTLGANYRDMPPLKACSLDALDSLRLTDAGHGFTVEMLVKAHSAKLRVAQVEVHCRNRRGGVSKVSGSLRGASRAAIKIVSTIATHALAERVGRVR